MRYETKVDLYLIINWESYEPGVCLEGHFPDVLEVACHGLLQGVDDGAVFGQELGRPRGGAQVVQPRRHQTLLHLLKAQPVREVSHYIYYH